MGQALQQVVAAIRNQAGSGVAQPGLFHEPTVTAGAGFGQGLSGAADVLADPRNAWMGLGPLGMLRFSRLAHLRDRGGFSMTPMEMLRSDTNIAPVGDSKAHMLDYLFGRRVDNTLAKQYLEGHPEVQRSYLSMTPEEQSVIDRTGKGILELQKERNLTQFAPEMGGSEVPPAFNPARFNEVWRRTNTR